MSIRWRLVALAVTTFALVSACGGDPGGNKVASLSDAPNAQDQQGGAKGDGHDADKFREFTKCMREHGVEMPDPESGPGGGVAIEMKEGDQEKMKAADEACRHLLPNGGAPPKLDAKQLDEMRKQAKCLREHGVNMPDPDPNNPEIKIEGSGDMEKDKKAFEACGGGILVGPGGGDASNGSGSGSLGIPDTGGGR